MTSWERPQVKKETHDRAVQFAREKGFKIWRVYEKAIEDLDIGGEKENGA